MAENRDEEIEKLAREMLRQAILDSGWYPSLRGERRRSRIEQDVDRHWHLMIAEARARLEQLQRTNA